MQAPIRIAMADDHLLMRQGLALLIESFDNISVIAQAGNGMELLEQLSKMQQLPDICIMDIKMPVLNGFDTLLEIKKRWPEIKVLTLSMYTNELSITKLLRNGADGYIIKGCAPKEFHKAILQVYHGGIYYPAELLKIIPKNPGPDIFKVLPTLTSKEYSFLSYCSTELTYKEIADRMNQSLRTIEGYRDDLLKKLKLKSRVGLAVFAIESGISVIKTAV